MKKSIDRAWRRVRLALVVVMALGVAGCDPQVYGSIGVSSGYSSWGGYDSGPRMHGSVSIGGRIM